MARVRIALALLALFHSLPANAARCFTSNDLGFDKLSLSFEKAKVSRALKDALEPKMRFRSGDSIDYWFSKRDGDVLFVVWDRNGCLVTVNRFSLSALQALIEAGRP